jgi:hypothetical protein
MKFHLIAPLLFCSAILATEPNDATRRWWSHVVALSGDELQGRDTGSEGYRKAAAYVVKQLEAAGLQPAGEAQGWFQSVPMRFVRLRADLSEAALVTPDGAAQPLKWLQHITIPARSGAPEAIDAALVFDGQPAADAPPIDLKGKILVRINAGRGAGGGRRGGGGAAAPGGALGTLTIDTNTGPEPPRWPVQYSVAVTLADAAPAQAAGPGLALRFNSAFAELLFTGSGHTYRETVDLAAAGKPLPRFELPDRLRARMKFESGDLKCNNVLGVLRGSDPVLANEYVVISAHLDGYGIGSPWSSDNIYNGSFDDAAYVATMIEFAQKLKESGTKLKRSILFGVWTGEEKGLLGSKWYVAHPTLPKESFVANVNLDQLRPIFPLKILTTLAVDDSTLGDTVRQVAGTMDIRIQSDPEPERNLLRRSDHWNFMGIGVPAVGFIFGYEKGTPEEAAYRQWYALRYHTPLDDLNQPWDPPAAAKFNDFFGKVVQSVANAGERPKWKAGSAYAPK